MDRYVCAFRGRRDYYQVPLALAETGLLDEFITDAYASSWLQAAAGALPDRWREKILSRNTPGIPAHRVRCLWGTTAVEHMRHRLGFAPSVTFAKLDGNFSMAAARRAAEQRAHLFLYSSYAWEAFVARYPHTPHKAMFQYHPHPAFERCILMDDYRRYPVVADSFAEESGEHLDERLRSRSSSAWKHADLIFCASTFTKRSLLDAGAAESLCRIVPYGIDTPEQEREAPAPDTFHALFVGSGNQRKGLHHLILAWRKARLRKDSLLTLVCRTIDRGIERMIADTPRVALVRGLSRDELARAFRVSTLFVMPSLVEGFGQVYLEALAHGCPVLGTPNTGLPDLGGEVNGIYLVEPGNVDELTARLEWLQEHLPGNNDIRTRAARGAGKFSWRRFRDDLTNAITDNAQPTAA